MRIGDFNRRATIQARASGFDEAGQPLTDWADFASKVPCNVSTKSGKAQIASGAEVSVVQAVVQIRWRTDITEGMRVLYNGDVFKINAVMPDYAGRRFVDLVCEVAK
ncbi:phage head closure protein [Caballeronia sp. AZ7_KS35]|uniref:phage head closure protein n=1 Tax=Caballeronia sp. AZ7_KS35 TaxID=2921762 RepID=UPI002028B3F2|nr:phage head closure protein [Caballeronia sp. AZ7_KS35]